MFRKILAAAAIFSLLAASVAHAAQQRAEAVRFGLLLPLSGNLKPLGTKVLEGVMLGSGLMSTKASSGVTFFIADTQGDPAKAAEGVKTLAAKGVTAIIGPMKGDEARAAAAVARSAGVPLVTITPARDVAGKGVYRLYLREEEEVERLVRYALDELGVTRFAILAPDTEQGKNYRRLFWDTVVENGGEIAGCELFPTSDIVNLKDPIQKLIGTQGLSEEEVRALFEKERQRQADARLALLLAEGPQAEQPEEIPKPARKKDEDRGIPTVDFKAVFLPVSSTEAAQIAPQFPYYDIDGMVLLGIRSWNYEALLKVGREYVEGALFPAEWSPASSAGGAFANDFADAYGREPGPLEAYGFDAAAVLLAARLAGAGSGRSSMDTYIATLDAFKGVTGPLTTTQGGDIAANPKILTVSNRRIVPAPRRDR